MRIPIEKFPHEVRRDAEKIDQKYFKKEARKMPEKEKVDPQAKKEKIDPQDFTGIISIKRSDEKPEFWKPTKLGEKIEGRLVAIIEGKFGKVLRVSTKKGMVSITQNFFLADVDFSQYADLVLRFTFKGEVGERKGRVYDVDLVGEEVPF